MRKGRQGLMDRIVGLEVELGQADAEGQKSTMPAYALPT